MPEMKYDVITVCPQIIGCYLNKKHHVHKPLLVEFLDKAKPDFVNNGIEHYRGSGSLLHDVEKFESIKRWVERCAHHFAENILQFDVGSKMHCVSSQLDVASAEGFQSPIQHVNAVITGAYFVRKNREHPGLAFFGPDLVGVPNRPCLMPGFKGQGPCNSPDMTTPPEGGLMLWQSHLAHGYPASGVDGRTVLSMNFLPETFNSPYKMRLCEA